MTSELGEGDGTLSVCDAFLVMSDFIGRFADEAGDDLATLLGDTTVEADGGPTDPAAWGDWLACVARIRSGLAPRSPWQP